MKIIFIFSCSRMFRDVPECSGMFHVPGFIDAQEKTPFVTQYNPSVPSLKKVLINGQVAFN